MATAADLQSIAAAGVEAQERFVADCIAMDRAWAAGEYDQWLASYGNAEREPHGDDGQDGTGDRAEAGAMAPEDSPELDADPLGPRGDDAGQDSAAEPDR